MSGPSTVAYVKRALVQTLRGDSALKAAVTGIYEGFAGEDAKFPFIVYSTVYAPYDYLWGSVVLVAGFDIFVLDRDPVRASNADQLIADALHDASLEVGGGQSTLICRRVSDRSFAGVDEEGTKYYQIGGSYEVWTDQPLPRTAASSFVAAATVV